MTPQELRDRTAALAVAIQQAVEPLASDTVCQDGVRQLLRASTSAAANYRAAGQARSRAEFLAKLSIALEEADESVFWLEHFNAVRPDPNRTALLDEARQVVLILGASRRTARRNLERLDRHPHRLDRRHGSR